MASIEKVPPEVEARLRKLREIQASLDRMVRDRSVLLASLNEIDRVLKELQELGEDVEVYKNLGVVLVKTNKDQVIKELEEKKESLEVKLKGLNSAIEKLQEEAKRLEEEIRRLIAGGGRPAAGG